MKKDKILKERLRIYYIAWRNSILEVNKITNEIKLKNEKILELKLNLKNNEFGFLEKNHYDIIKLSSEIYILKKERKTYNIDCKFWKARYRLANKYKSIEKIKKEEKT